MNPQTALIDRLRGMFADEPTQREVSMFGGRSFMINDKMAVAARKDGGLLVRVPADQHDELLGRDGAHQAEMGAGRTMGPGWIEIEPEAIDADDALRTWVDVAMAYNRDVTGTW